MQVAKFTQVFGLIRGCEPCGKENFFGTASGTRVAIGDGNPRAPPRATLARHVRLDDPFMIATAPVAERTETTRPGLDRLLLGDLREILEEPAGGMRDRWLLATLDMLLMSRPRSSAAVPRPSIGCDRSATLLSRMPTTDPVPFGKLQRLRDRIVHRAPSGVLIQELKDDLRAYFDGLALVATL